VAALDSVLLASEGKALLRSGDGGVVRNLFN